LANALKTDVAVNWSDAGRTAAGAGSTTDGATTALGLAALADAPDTFVG
jgi:hypothetical protein